MMTVENLEKELKNNELKSLYFLYGEETFLLESCLKKIKTLFGECIKGINCINIDETNYKELIAEIETPAFGYEKKLIIVRNSGLLKNDGKRKNVDITNAREKLVDFIEKNMDMINLSTVIVFIEENADSRFKIYKTLDKLGVVCKFDLQKQIAIEKRISAICTGYKVKIDGPTLKYFIECCGLNMQDLINEIRKLIEYVGEAGQIKKDDIDLLSIKKLESIIFDLTDSFGKKDIKKALDVLNNLIYAKEPIQKILITLYNHFKKIYITKLASKYNKDVATSLELKPNQAFLVGKYKMQANYFQESELKEVLQCLRDLDYQYKNGLIDLQVGLESILCKYCS